MLLGGCLTPNTQAMESVVELSLETGNKSIMFDPGNRSCIAAQAATAIAAYAASAPVHSAPVSRNYMHAGACCSYSRPDGAFRLK